MENVVNFKRVELMGSTKEEALAKAPFNIMGDATQAYKNWKKTADASSDVNDFYRKYLTEKSKNVAGVGFSITIDPAVLDNRKRPCKIEDVKNEKGKRKYATVLELRDDKTGTVLGKVAGIKSNAKDLTKKLYKDGFKGNLTAVYSKQVAEGEPKAFTAKYAPSKGSHAGTYVVFGVVAD